MEFLGMHDGRGDIAFLLTSDTGNAGTSPHVARRFFQWYSMTNIAIYIINNELRYHCSINYITNTMRTFAFAFCWPPTMLFPQGKHHQLFSVLFHVCTFYVCTSPPTRGLVPPGHVPPTGLEHWWVYELRFSNLELLGNLLIATLAPGRGISTVWGVLRVPYRTPYSSRMH